MLLASFEGEGRIEVRLGTGSEVFRRVGATVERLSDGARGTLFLIDEVAGFHLAERAYAGRLSVEPHPSGGLRLFNLVALEDYVRGVVAAELPIWSAPPALLEAQAVCARSYALANLSPTRPDGRRSFLFDSTLDQAYRGEYVPAGGAESQRVAERLREAVERTRGLVLAARGRVLDTRFHASCGGTTARFADVFPQERDPGAMIPVACHPCRDPETEGVSWEWRPSSEERDSVARRLGLSGSLQGLVAAQRDDHGRWLEVEVRGGGQVRVVGLSQLRSVVGWNRFKGGRVTAVEPAVGTPRVVAGRGRGHGVGLCQTGARAWADAGWSSLQLLEHYYPGARLARSHRARP